MIDKYKREKAARQISEKVVDAKGFDNSKPTHIAFLEGHIDGFNAGAKWAINEFLKDLWNPISDKPEEHTDIIYIDEDKDFWDINNYDSNNFDDSFGKGWESACRTQDIYKWAYKDDLLPKEGGKQ